MESGDKGAEFGGRLYFDVASRDVWHFYRFLTSAADRGAVLRLSWVPFLTTDDDASLRALASFAAVKQDATAEHGAYLQALLSHHHLDGAPLDQDETYEGAAATAGIDVELAVKAAGGREAVRAATDEARVLGVHATPTLYRHGPVLRIRVNPAALDGDVLGRLQRIDDVLGDDGIWVLEKP